MKISTKYIKIFLNILVFIITCILIFWVGPKALTFFMPFVIGGIIAMIANPLVRFFEKKLKIVRKLGSVIVIILALALVVIGGYFAITKIIDEISGFITNLPEMYNGLENQFNEIAVNLQGVTNNLPQNIQDSLNDFGNEIGQYTSKFVSNMGEPTFIAASNFAKNIPSTFIGIIITLLSSYFFVSDREKVIQVYKKIIPKGIQSNVKFIFNNFVDVVGGYFKAQFKIMLIVFLIVWIGLLILSVKYSVLFAVLIALLDMLPFFGTGSALGPWAVWCFLSFDYKMGFGLIIIYIVSQIVRQLIQPKVLGDSMGLNPLLTLVFMYIGFKISSVIGMILAVPIGIIIINLYKAGFFDEIIKNVKVLVEDFNNFRGL